ncbi:MAG: hypothetical protein QM775_16625 [Pirellulales bacterium]
MNDYQTYPGGKNAEGVWQRLIGKQPTHAYYVETHVGSGGLLRRKVPALKSVVCDLDPDVVDHWRRLKFPGTEVVHGCGITWLRANADRLDRDWLVYCDPPYLPEVRSKKKLYRFEMTARATRGITRRRVTASMPRDAKRLRRAALRRSLGRMVA